MSEGMNTGQKIEWVHHALQEAINGCADEAMLEQALEFVEDIRELQQDTLKVVSEWFDAYGGDENEWRKLEQALGLPLTPLSWEGECIQEYDWEMKRTKVCGCVECWPESQNVEGGEE